MSNKLNTRIGILGGGQLGKMLMESFSPTNARYTFLEVSEDCPARLVCSNQIKGSLYDVSAIEELSKQSDVLTYEIEHVNIEALKSSSIPVIPYPSVLEIIQDKGLQKEYYTGVGAQTLPYKLSSSQELAEDVRAFGQEQFVLKHRKGGYDGKGVQLLTIDRFNEMWEAKDPLLQSEHGYVIEQMATNAREISVIVCVGRNGEIVTYEPSEMVFEPEANLMDYLITPCDLDEQTILKSKELAIRAVKGFNSPGIFAVELFVDGSREIYINEIAPRPHNSGHHTIESCYTSQYEQLNRILLDLPLGSTKPLAAGLTANILGPKDVEGEHYLEGLEEVMKIEGVYIHMYGKTHTKPFRKLGHFNVIAENAATCIERMNLVRKHLRIVSLD